MRSVVLLLLSACSWTSQVDCESPEQELGRVGSEILVCGDVEPVHRAVELLTGRILRRDARLLNGDVRDRFLRAPDVWKREKRRADELVRALEEVEGLEGARRRSHIIAEVLGDKPLFDEGTYSRTILERQLIIYERSPTTGLVLTEQDVEGWLRYASLCSEARDRGPLRLSVADRNVLYSGLRQRFRDADLEEQVALTSMGAFWKDAELRWAAAPYPTQKRWIDRAPIPLQTNASSLGFAELVFDAGLKEHARVFQEEIGPLRLVPM